MRRTKTLASLVTAATVAMVGFGATAANAVSGDTIATFTVTGSAGLAITVPASTVALTSTAAAGGVATSAGSLGDVQVTDGRGALLATWVTTVTSTDFVTGAGATANTKVTPANITYNPGLVGAATVTGNGTFVPGTAGAIGAGRIAGSMTLATGVNTAQWNPTLAFTLATDQVAGTYTGTVTHSAV
ncbi:MAG: hypothetical protein JJD92_06960 [Frankiaceae bacterium]|nr:hypothetical protein [Frankiaceae bacterium]